MGLQVILGADCRAQTQRIVDSKPFKSSAIHRELLSYLAEKSLAGDADELNEYAVGVDCLGKPTEYDPRQDSSVRMHVARLRQKLDEYYRTEGADDPIIVDLPKGGFKVVFESRPAAPEPVPEVSADQERASFWFRKELLFVAAIALVLGAAAYFATHASHTERASTGMPAGWSPELQQLWAPLLTTGRPLAVCIATPSFGSATGAF